MAEYIKRDSIIGLAHKLRFGRVLTDREVEMVEMVVNSVRDDVRVDLVKCQECKHRPTKPKKYADGFDLAFPDDVCPCYFDEDPYYSWYPSDGWFCPRGERRGGADDDDN